MCRESSGTAPRDAAIGLYTCRACDHTFSLSAPGVTAGYSNEYYRDWNKNYFSHPDTGLFSRVLATVMRITGTERLRLLDVGCGRGDFLGYAARTAPGIELTGVDIAGNAPPSIRFVKGDFLTVSFSGRFDAITAFQVIEHTADPVAFIEKIRSLLEPGGAVYLTTINDKSLVFALARVANRFGLSAAYRRFYRAFHLQHFTNRSLKYLLERNGFSIVEHRNHNYPLGAVDVPRAHPFVMYLYRAAVILIFAVAGPLNTGMVQTIVARRSEDRNSPAPAGRGNQ